MFDDLEIRYHFPDSVDLDPSEPVILERLRTGSHEWVRFGVAPDDVRGIDSIRAHVRQVALDRGGEAWRAVTERGEVLVVYSVSDRADELNGKPAVTLHPRDQLSLAMARVEMCATLG
jgi:hypothetical protein